MVLFCCCFFWSRRDDQARWTPHPLLPPFPWTDLCRLGWWTILLPGIVSYQVMLLHGYYEYSLKDNPSHHLGLAGLHGAYLTFHQASFPMVESDDTTSFPSSSLMVPSWLANVGVETSMAYLAHHHFLLPSAVVVALLVSIGFRRQLSRRPIGTTTTTRKMRPWIAILARELYAGIYMIMVTLLVIPWLCLHGSSSHIQIPFMPTTVTVPTNQGLCSMAMIAGTVMMAWWMTSTPTWAYPLPAAIGDNQLVKAVKRPPPPSGTVGTANAEPTVRPKRAPPSGHPRRSGSADEVASLLRRIESNPDQGLDLIVDFANRRAFRQVGQAMARIGMALLMLTVAVANWTRTGPGPWLMVIMMIWMIMLSLWCRVMRLYRVSCHQKSVPEEHPGSNDPRRSHHGPCSGRPESSYGREQTPSSQMTASLGPTAPPRFGSDPLQAHMGQMLRQVVLLGMAALALEATLLAYRCLPADLGMGGDPLPRPAEDTFISRWKLELAFLASGLRLGWVGSLLVLSHSRRFLKLDSGIDPTALTDAASSLGCWWVATVAYHNGYIVPRSWARTMGTTDTMGLPREPEAGPYDGSEAALLRFR